jgi:peptidoglycan hydrolase-like protein with peptidoglycan-binding domain
METLAYLHLALAHEAPADTDETAAISGWESPKLLTWLNQQKLSTGTALHLLSLAVALGVLGMAHQASAAVRQGDRGKEVSTLQERLQELGYFKADVTGYFGSLTKEAVRQFQQDKGLTPDGVVGTNTEAALHGQASQSLQPISESSNGTWQLGDRGERVSTIQKRLALAGLSSGDKGVFDEATQDAVRQFQQTKGLKVDGIVGDRTLAALPEIGASEPKEQKPAPKKPTSFFENESAPLTPFIRKRD